MSIDSKMHFLFLLFQLYREDEYPIDTAKSVVNPTNDQEEEHQQYKEQGFFPEPGRASPLPVADLLEQTGYNIEEDKPILESGRREAKLFFPRNVSIEFELLHTTLY